MSETSENAVRTDWWRLALLLDLSRLNCDDDVMLALVNDPDHGLARDLVAIINEERERNGGGDHPIGLIGACWTAADQAEQAAVHISGRDFVSYLQGLVRQCEAIREDIASVLTVYDEHVQPENRGPWRDRLATYVASGFDTSEAPDYEGEFDGTK